MDFKQKLPNKPRCPEHTQIVHYDNGKKLTLVGVIMVWQDTLVHLITKDNRHYLVNPERVLHTEILL